ncbi:hypothetical protein AI2828V5_1521 [Klebsiella oxytoca]|nr:hypothetical protein AI2828V5_1521 [Klebsiella oxytoca]CAH5816446.1 hypothetical protein AI2828V5_1521 [Klebsiella oxytoca]
MLADSLFAFLDVKDKYSAKNIDFKCFYNSIIKMGTLLCTTKIKVLCFLARFLNYENFAASPLRCRNLAVLSKPHRILTVIAIFLLYDSAIPQ